ncbi:hypothetical protein NXS19_014386 [Fusarium pseudograminearum]|nr:hypothetical protein NXS19_014386 [Fusarium pseudograminearum]
MLRQSRLAFDLSCLIFSHPFRTARVEFGADTCTSEEHFVSDWTDFREQPQRLRLCWWQSRHVTGCGDQQTINRRLLGTSSHLNTLTISWPQRQRPKLSL